MNTRRPLVVNSIEELIGNTPLLRLKRSLPPSLKSELFAKIELMNPGGSVKDRIAKSIIDRAEKSGELKPGGTLVEATSGNTGAGIALMAVSRGYKAVLVMPDKMSAEKINVLRAYGAKVVITPSQVNPDHPSYYCNVAKRLAKELPKGFLANQYFNPDNPAAHYESTGPEIWEQCEGRIDAFIAGIGTGGTLTGVARYLRQKNPKIKIIAVDPKGSIYSELIRSGKIGGHDRYLVEGIGEDMVPGTIDIKLIDECITTGDAESFAAARMLAETEALLVGGSCGSAWVGAVQYLKKHEASGGQPLRAVVLLPDSGSRYLSKVFNSKWLKANQVLQNWESRELGGAVEYVEGAKSVEGIDV